MEKMFLFYAHKAIKNLFSHDYWLLTTHASFAAANYAEASCLLLRFLHFSPDPGCFTPSQER